MIAVLFARHDSVYKTMPDCDVWDIDRDARRWPGGGCVIAHPPCRAWGRLRTFAKPRPDEMDLAVWAVEQVRKWGGVLEHPRASLLWPHCDLPMPGYRDHCGGFTLPIHQHWLGHRAEKATLLYIVGCEPRDTPAFPLRIDEPTHIVGTSGRRNDGTKIVPGDPRWRPEIPKAERERTPRAMAEWLCSVARRCRVESGIEAVA